MKFLRVILPFFLVAPILLTWFLVFAAPFGSPQQKPVSLLSLFPILLLSFLLFRAAWSFLKEQNHNRGWILFLLFCLGAFCTSIFGGVAIHQDFFGYIFMAIIQLVILGFLRFDLLFPELQLSESRTKVYFLGLLTLVLFIIWIILMGYALVTRQEPRWWESFIYNLYNIVLTAVLVFATLQVARLPKRRVQTSKNLLIVDELDFSQLLGAGGCAAAWQLLSHPEGITCSKIMLKAGQHGCISCHEEKASRCPIYSDLFNHMRLVRKLLEALRLGVVKGPEERQTTPLLGWQLLKQAEVEIVDLESKEGSKPPRKHSVPEKEKSGG